MCAGCTRTICVFSQTHSACARVAYIRDARLDRFILPLDDKKYYRTYIISSTVRGVAFESLSACLRFLIVPFGGAPANFFFGFLLFLVFFSFLF